MRSVVAVIISYCAISLIVFGSLLKPIMFATVWSDRLGIPSWRWVALGCVAVSSIVLLIPSRLLPSRPIKLSLFVAFAMTTLMAAIGSYSDHLRNRYIENFAADDVVTNSFFESITEAPREFQRYLHSAALKDCIAFGWSYRTMSFYQIPPSAAKNVVPHSWLEQCPSLEIAATAKSSEADFLISAHPYSQ